MSFSVDSSATGQSETISAGAPAVRNARLNPQISSPLVTRESPLSQAESVIRLVPARRSL